MILSNLEQERGKKLWPRTIMGRSISWKRKSPRASRMTYSKSIPVRKEKRRERDVLRIATKSASARIMELARPTKQRALNTLNEKATTLPPAFVDNLVKIVEAESCLTPEEAARIRRRRERRIRKTTRLPPPLAKKRAGEIVDDTARATMLDRDATMCQYLMAERFVKSILESRHETRKDIREIADVIMKRLTSLDGYADTKNGDRATRQLRLLADVVACWMVEILLEVADSYKEALKKYGKKRRMKMLEVDDDNEMNSKTEDWKQTEKMKEKENQDEKNYETIQGNNPMKEKNNDEQKGKNKDDDAEKKEREKEQLEREAKSEDVRNETVDKEEKNEENRKEEKEEEGKEVREMEEREDKE